MFKSSIRVRILRTNLGRFSLECCKAIAGGELSRMVSEVLA